MNEMREKKKEKYMCVWCAYSDEITFRKYHHIYNYTKQWNTYCRILFNPYTQIWPSQWREWEKKTTSHAQVLTEYEARHQTLHSKIALWMLFISFHTLFDSFSVIHCLMYAFSFSLSHSPSLFSSSFAFVQVFDALWPKHLLTFI